MTADQTKLDDLLRKIRALKAKAEDPSVSEAEAMLFTAKVAELLAKHGLEEAQLKVEDQAGLGHEQTNEKMWNASPARRALVLAVCTLYMVKTLRYSSGAMKGTWILIGRPHNIIMVKEMSEYLIKTVLRLSNEYGRKNKGANVIDFRRGCFLRVAERLYELQRQQARSAEPVYTPTGNPGNLPALYKNEMELAQAYLRQHWPNAGASKGRAIKQGWDAMAGRAAGDSISLSRQVGGGRSNHLIGKR